MSKTCRFCQTPLQHSFADLGLSPLSNSYVRPEHQDRGEKFYPLHAYVCSACKLVQLEEFESPEAIFSDYAYFSSYSTSWLEHAQHYCQAMRERFGLGAASQVVELASNDGYLLQYFQQMGVPVLGVEPAANVAKVAMEKGIPTRVAFFGVATAEAMLAAGESADLLLGNNVLAHVPDLNDFVAGMQRLLKPDGVITMEFPHLLQLMQHNQFDTIYHEHFSYFSLLTVQRVFARHGLALFDVEELPTHGGSLRIYARHSNHAAASPTNRLLVLREREIAAGLDDLPAYASFAEQVRETKRKLLEFLIAAKRQGKRIAGYGAPAKGNTLLNYCGIRSDFIDFTVDRNPAKQGTLLPGTRIPVFAPERIMAEKPDYLLILPWNLRDEVMQQMAGIRAWGGQFVVPIPAVAVLP